MTAQVRRSWPRLATALAGLLHIKCGWRLLLRQAAARFHAMKQSRSIAFHLFLVFLFFFFLTIVLGLFSVWRLSDFNRVSADVRDIWLPNTRFIGDLNNFTSDFRAAEGTNLLATTPVEFAANEQEIKELDRSIGQAQRGYERLPHSAAEAQIYRRFDELWNRYRSIVGNVMSHAPGERKANAVQVYMTESRAAYPAASDTLTQLTDRNAAAAREASELAERAFGQARWLIGAAMVIAGLMTLGALLHVRRSLSAPLLGLAASHAAASQQSDEY
jgi:two-component system, OmpR family, sensor kinase